MVHTLKKKLNSNRGASMILVLALFLICIMVSSVIIASAASGISRNAQREKQQQGYLAISSAVDLLREELENLNDNGVYVGSCRTKRYGCQDCTIAASMYYFGGTVDGYRLDASYIQEPLDDGHLLIDTPHREGEEVKGTDSNSTALSGIFGDLFYRASEHVYEEGKAYREWITIDLANKDERLPEVTCEFVMDYQYNMLFVLTTEQSSYSVRIEVNAQKVESTPSAMYITDPMDPEADIHKIYYKKYQASDGSFIDAKDEDFVIPVRITTVVTTVKWGKPVVEKGVLSQ